MTLAQKISRDVPVTAPMPLAPHQRAAYAAAIEQTEAIFALEGMEPTAQDKMINAAILAGRVSPEQARQERLEYVTANKTSKGFIESRAWKLP